MAVPKGLPPLAAKAWREPWAMRRILRGHPFQRGALRRALDKRGLITPHFAWSEARCKDGTPVPRLLRAAAQRHAWNLEIFRHAIGDRSLSSNSWFRTPSWNRKQNGARFSRHMRADATDFTRETVNRIGRGKWFAVANRVFANGGVGDYPVGSAHLDSRGVRARWRSY